MRCLLLPVVCSAALAACAPAPTSTASQPATVAASTVPAPLPAGFRAAFSEQGVAWVSGGRACVARAPSYTPQCPKLAAAVDVAWNGGDVWAAVPGLGVAVTLDRSARTVNVGRVVALSATRAYREDGSAVAYTGAALRGVLGAPAGAITGGDGEDYVLLAGRLLRVSDGARLGEQAGPYLGVTPGGAQAFSVPTVVTPAGTYRLGGGRLERLDQTGQVLTGVQHPPGLVGTVGQELVTVTAEGTVRVFGSDLTR